MSKYIATVVSVLPTAGQDIMTAVAPAGGAIELVEVDVAGRGSSAASQLLQVAMSSGGAGPTLTVAASKLDSPDQRAPDFTVYGGMTVQPTLDASPFMMPFNSQGGGNRMGDWARINGIYRVRDGGQISFRAATGITWQAAALTAIFRRI